MKLVEKYNELLRKKIDIAPESGIDIEKSEVNQRLKPHQIDAIWWAVKGGKRALFESFGLGKTVQELEWCRIIQKHEGGQAIIVMPLEVRKEFVRDAVNLLGMEPPPYVKSTEEAKKTGAPIVLTNYERVRGAENREGTVDLDAFTAVSLDEASVLRGYGTRTYQEFLKLAKRVKYKLVATATPAPNRYKELIHYAAYLGIMDSGQALTRWFKRDSTKANNLTLFPGKEKEFWLWISSWALFIQKPSDLGYSNEGYDLPPLKVNWIKLNSPIEVSTEENGQEKMTVTSAMSLKEAAKVKRESIEIRVAKAKEIIDKNPDDHFIIWHDLESERKEIKKQIPEVTWIYGKQDPEERVKTSDDFAEGRTRLLATKKELSGSGCNFQRHCHKAIFLGIDYEFNDFIQAIHRIYRFLQDKECEIDILYMDREDEIKSVLEQKWKQYEEMGKTMSEILKKYGLSETNRANKLARSIGVEREVVKGEHFVAVHNDCVLEIDGMKDNSIGLIHTSIPFSNHYEYSASYNDFGHNESTEKFFEQMDYLSPNLLRVLKPGRVMAVHVKDRVLFGNVTGTGMPTMEPFHAMCIRHYMKHGFQYFGMITILTDVVRENNQTYRLGYTENCKDGTKMGVGCPEYILLFRKLPTDTSKAYADEPVKKDKADYSLARWQIDASGFWRSSGNRRITPEEAREIPIQQIQKMWKDYDRSHVYNYDEHVKVAEELGDIDKLSKTFETVPCKSWSSYVWDDINRMYTLNSEQSARRERLHICPLQIDIVKRIIERYSSPGDVILDPFAGLFTVPEEAVKMGREGIGIELNRDYFEDGVTYCKSAEEKVSEPTLFDFMKEVS